MPRKGRSNEESVHALHQAESGERVAEVCRGLGVSEQTFYRWKKQFAGMGLSEVRETTPAPSDRSRRERARQFRVGNEGRLVEQPLVQFGLVRMARRPRFLVVPEEHCLDLEIGDR